MFIGIVVAVAVIGLIAWFAAKARARALVGPLRLTVSDREPLLGQELTVRLRITPPGAPRINGLELTFHCYEWIRWTETQTSTDSKGRTTTRTVTRTRTQTLFTKSWRERVGVAVANRTYTVEGTIRIPPDAPPSFSEAPNNKLVWKLEGSVDIGGLPDLHSSATIHVQPVVSAEA